MYSKVLRNDKRMKTSFILVFLIILGHFGQASNKDKKSMTKSTGKSQVQILLLIVVSPPQDVMIPVENIKNDQ